MSRLSIPLLLALFFGQAQAASDAEGVAPPTPIPVIFGFYEFPPSIYTAADGVVRGRMHDLAEAMLRRAGYAPEFRSLPSARLYNGLRDGSVHLWAGSRKPDLQDYVLESRSLLTETTLNLYYRADTPKPKIPQDLIGRDLILISGYTYWPNVNAMLADPALAVVLHRTSNHVSALQMLERRRGDFLLDYAVPVDQAREELDMPPLPYVVLAHLPIHYIISRKAPQPEALRDALDQVYDEMIAAGEEIGLP